MNPSFHPPALAVLAVCLSIGHIPSPAAEIEMAGEISHVTIYPGRARVVRQLELPADAELQQVHVTNLPSRVVVRSAYTEADPGIHVQSMRIDSRAAGDDPEQVDQLQKLHDRNDTLRRELRDTEHQATVIEQDLLTIDKLVDFSADKTKQNLDRATLDVQSVTQLADFTMQRRRELAEELLQTQEEIERLNHEIEENNEQRQELISPAEDAYEAVLTVSSPRGGNVRLVYVVDGVDWSPRYSIRAVTNEASRSTFDLRLDALIVQTSGEPWNDVAVTISTSTPDRQATRPLLTPLRVEAVAPGQGPSADPITADGSGDLQAGWLDHDTMQRDVHLNSLANRRQVTELTSAAQVQRKIAADAGDDVSDESYRLESRLTIPNQSQLQTVTIMTQELSGEMHHVVTPLLSSFAHREAELTNTSGQNLIAGNADVYLDREFVGQTVVPPTAVGQRLTCGFGVDRRVRTRRELLSKEQTVQGGNRRSTLSHRLVVSNYHERPIEIRLLDRIPVATQDGSIGVSLDADSEEALSDDKLYQRMQRPTGVLRWDLTIPAERFGSDAYDHEYSYSIELDREQTIVSGDLEASIEDLEFQHMNMGGMGGGMGGMGGAPF